MSRQACWTKVFGDSHLSQVQDVDVWYLAEGDDIVAVSPVAVAIGIPDLQLWGSEANGADSRSPAS